MKVRPIRKDTSGVNFVLEYILTFMIASILFSIMLMMANGLFIQGPESTVSKVQFTDIGNDLTAKIIDTYLIAPTSPDYGDVNTTFDMPNTVAGHDYVAKVDNSANGWDKEVVLSSTSNDVAIKVTLNGVNSTIPINGETMSNSPDHRIWYNSTNSSV